jgi:hypothetical protein
MPFCDEGRQPLMLSRAAHASPHATPLAWHAPIRDAVALRYRGLGPFTSRSPRTGRLYACGGAGATLQVEAADARPMLRTRLFKRA